MALRPLRALLFDLDGTLVDSAPDLAAAANAMRVARGLPPLPLAQLRPHAGSGARGMLGCALGRRPGDADYEPLRIEFLDRYEACMLHSAALFDGVPALLQALQGLQARGVAWGIVTNKAMRFAQPLGLAMGLLPAAQVLVAGDSTPHTKPHPAPLLAAVQHLGVTPADCVYVGDDHRDMLAGRAAGMAVWAAAWGYLGPGADVQQWAADAVLQHPQDLLGLLP